MRQPKISSKIFKDISNVHYHLDESLVHFADNRFNIGLSDQQFVMTSTNNLAYLLSNVLNAMQNPTPSSGSGKGKKKGNSFSLPDIIQKQGEMMEKMKSGMKPGEIAGEQKGKEGKSGEKSGDGEGEQMNGELYEIYKQQAQMRQQLKDLMGDKKGKDGKGHADEAENELLGFTANAQTTLYHAAGCSECGGTGYKGRRGIYEIIEIDDHMKTLIHNGAGEIDMTKHARTQSKSIQQDGFQKVIEGETTLEEVLRVTKA